MNDNDLIVVAMSGGVDSSVAAARLVEAGHRVVGMMLRLWSEPGSECSNRCCTPDAMAQARKVAQMLGIPFYAVDAQSPFRESVVQHFLDGYSAGVTPNPCIVCNQSIRWGVLYEQARSLGATHLATGHYARVRVDGHGQARLLKGLDPAKDQSYVLSVIPQDKLRHSLFPIGEFPKPEVREMARSFGLPVAERPDSQDLCFLAGDDYRSFLLRNAPESVRPGVIVDQTGRSLGQHQGLAFYTIGQRKGLGFSSEKPLYVIGKDVRENRLIVGEAEELGSTELVAGDINWIAGEPVESTLDVTVKIRYKAREIPAKIQWLDAGRVRVQFKQSLRDITPGQRAVFYQDEECLGGGTILTS